MNELRSPDFGGVIVHSYDPDDAFLTSTNPRNHVGKVKKFCEQSDAFELDVIAAAKAGLGNVTANNDPPTIMLIPSASTPFVNMRITRTVLQE